jgi:hypothetical protein
MPTTRLQRGYGVRVRGEPTTSLRSLISVIMNHRVPVEEQE